MHLGKGPVFGKHIPSASANQNTGPEQTPQWIFHLPPSALQTLGGFFSSSLVDSLVIQTDENSGAIALAVSLSVTR